MCFPLPLPFKGSLGEHKIRELNDLINKLLREKKHWEKQIKYLGGKDYELLQPRVIDADGKGAWGNDGYFYFGAAKELPGVRELFEKKSKSDETKQNKTNKQTNKQTNNYEVEWSIFKNE